ncbi:MAG TPA: hypothetical protein VNC11_06480 [Gemmatimonadaceae bacterium]|jgi:hypothetical protein|nr:hypothetical protein [Gemmatimonadaceae bacterium]
MRLGPFGRILTAFFSLWFAFTLAEPVLAMHDCPVHDGVGAVGAASHHSNHHGSSHNQAKHLCSCLGECAACALVALPSAPRTESFAETTRATDDSPLVASGYEPAWADHVLPFQNAPPAV